MIIGYIEGATRILGAPEGNPEVKPLAIRDIQYDDGTHAVMSAWMPTPNELAAMNAGEPVYLIIFGVSMPPAYVCVKGVTE